MAFLLCWGLLTGWAQEETVRVGDAPPWVVPLEVSLTNGVSSTASTDAIAYLASDTQVSIGEKNSEEYSRVRMTVLNAQGVQETTGLSVVHDPEYRFC